MLSKFTFTASLLLAMTAHSLQAKIWTVSPRPGANFTTLSGAVASSSVLAGDTILVSGAPASYAGFTISKKLTIIGPGYFLNENTGLQADTNSAKISSQVTINAQGTTLMGLFLNELSINADNVTITRCRMRTTSAGSYPVYIYAKDSVIIRQCFITQAANYYYNCITVTNFATQIFIQNNFIEYLGGQPSYGSIIINGTMSGDISNNVIYGNIFNGSGGFTFNNNILGSGTFSPTANITYNNNIGNSTQFGTANGNQQNVSMSAVFVGSGTSDSKWQVMDAGPADNTGLDGTDCGMFGGASPYRLSGAPSIPLVYSINGSIDGSLLNMNVKIKSNN